MIEVEGLDFRYTKDGPLVLRDLDFRLDRGARCLLFGANGAGKTTLLRVLGGKHMVDDAKVRVLGRPAFSDTSLVRDVTFLSGPFPLEVDIRVSEILGNIGAKPARREALLQILGVDPAWRMHRVSDGQRRRVQLLIGLLKEAKVLLLDEITTDLDLLARADLLAFLRETSDAGDLSLLYATHILDRLEDWATHLAYVVDGQIKSYQTLDAIKASDEYQAVGPTSPLTLLMERWLRRDA